MNSFGDLLLQLPSTSHLLKSNALMSSAAGMDKKTLAKNKSAAEIAQTFDLFVEEDDVPL